MTHLFKVSPFLTQSLLRPGDLPKSVCLSCITAVATVRMIGSNAHSGPIGARPASQILSNIYVKRRLPQSAFGWIYLKPGVAYIGLQCHVAELVADQNFDSSHVAYIE